MYSMNDKVSTRQVKLILILDMFSVSVLILPRVTVEVARQDGWILVIGGTLLAFLYSWFIAQLVKKFPEETFVDFSGHIVTRPIGMLLSLFILLFFILSAAIKIRIFGELTKQILLPDTPIEFIIISLLLICTYLSRKGYECRARVAEILFPITLIPLILILLFAIPKVEIPNLAPFFQLSWKEFFSGSYYVSLTYITLILLLFSNAFVQPPNKSGGICRTSLLVVGLLKLSTVVMTIAIFGAKGTQRQIWPVMTLMQVIHLPASFIERQEALMMIFWLNTVFSIVSGYLYFSSVIVTKMIKSNEQFYLVLPLLPFIYILSLYPSDIIEVYNWQQWLRRKIGPIFLIVIPFLLWLIAKIRKVGATSEEKK